MLFGCSNKQEDTKLTIADLQKRDPRYEGLCEVSYFHGGGMEGSSHRIELVKKDDRVTLTFYDRAFPGQADLVRVYQVKDIFEELDSYVREYNLSLWNEFPEPEMFPLDAPGTSLTLRFDPPEGEKFIRSMSIDYGNDIPREGYTILNDFVAKITALALDENLADVYFGSEYEIRTGKDIENSDEEIESILNGYWENGDTRFDVDTYNKTAQLLLPEKEWKVFDLKEKVDEPYKDIDCSWHLIYAAQEDEADIVYVTLDKQYLYVEDSSGNGMRFERR